MLFWIALYCNKYKYVTVYILSLFRLIFETTVLRYLNFEVIYMDRVFNAIYMLFLKHF